jgi:hypothetical protein
VTAGVIGLGSTALTASTVAVVWPLDPAVAAALSPDAVPDVSRRAAASIIKDTGVSAGAAGALPAGGLNNGASTVPMVVTAVTGSRGAAVAVVIVSLSAPTGSDTRTAAAPDCSAVPEVGVPDAFVVAAGGVDDERTSLSAPV